MLRKTEATGLRAVALPLPSFDRATWPGVAMLVEITFDRYGWYLTDVRRTTTTHLRSQTRWLRTTSEQRHRAVSRYLSRIGAQAEERELVSVALGLAGETIRL